MTVDQELRRAATSLAGVEVAVPPYARVRRRQRARRVTGALTGAVVALLAIVAVASLTQGDEGSVRVTSEGSSTTAPSSSTSPDPTAETRPVGSVAAFCAAATEDGGEVPESYVGTPEHVADVTRYAEVAPPEIRAQVETFLAFLVGGGIDPADPDSKLVENFPPPARTAAEEIEAFIAEEC